MPLNPFNPNPNSLTNPDSIWSQSQTFSIPTKSHTNYNKTLTPKSNSQGKFISKKCGNSWEAVRFSSHPQTMAFSYPAGTTHVHTPLHTHTHTHTLTHTSHTQSEVLCHKYCAKWQGHNESWIQIRSVCSVL